MMIKTLGIDIAKNVFQLHGTDENGEVILKKRVSRRKLLETLESLPPCLVGMEACGGAHYWARTIQEMGHSVKLISPQYVKPYVKTNKNDANDAEAICEAVTRPHMHFVAIKSKGQQDIQMLHRIRSRLVRDRTSLANQIRGLLMEYGLVIPQGMGRLRSDLPEIIKDLDNTLSPVARDLFQDLYDQFLALLDKCRAYDLQVIKLCRSIAICEILTKIPGIGPLTATAFVSSVGDPSIFKNGRQCASWLGLVPRQSSSGCKQRLLGISKRGDKYLRSLLIHGARSIVPRLVNKKDALSLWVTKIRERRGFNKACVALANKNSRILWAMMSRGCEYEVSQA